MNRPGSCPVGGITPALHDGFNPSRSPRLDIRTGVAQLSAGPYTVASPRWSSITDELLEELVGQPVDLSRGDGYVPREPEPVEELHYATAWVIRLPRPRPFRQSGCMPSGTPWWRRLGRQLVPRRTGRDCCWYHGGDWHEVSKRAIRLLRQAQRAGVAVDDIAGYVADPS